jgi:hypothetical protein
VRRLVVWGGIDAWRAEAASVELTPSGLRAEGTQIGIEPLPYRLDYRLQADERWVTRSLRVEAAGEGWSSRLELVNDGRGRWRCARADGPVELPQAEADAGALEGALDADLGFSPLTNLLPVRRAGLHRGPGALDLVAAWVSVPDLGVQRSEQRYEGVRVDPGGAVVRYRDLGAHDGFVAELELDADGLVVLYPGLARRLTP